MPLDLADEEQAALRLIEAAPQAAFERQAGEQHRSGDARQIRAIEPMRCVIGKKARLHLWLLNRVRSSRRLEAETHRNIEVIWLLRHLKPDFKTIADFRRDNRNAFRQV